jgi:hypothetical protein
MLKSNSKKIIFIVFCILPAQQCFGSELAQVLKQNSVAAAKIGLGVAGIGLSGLCLLASRFGYSEYCSCNSKITSSPSTLCDRHQIAQNLLEVLKGSKSLVVENYKQLKRLNISLPLKI